MATTLFGYVYRNNISPVGRIVYRPFNTNVLGVVTREVSDIGYGIEIKWQNGEVQITNQVAVNDFQSLIDEHVKKIETHTATLNNALEMLGIGSEASQ